MKYLGAHISSAKNFELIPYIANATGITAMQTYVTNPQRWATKPVEDAKAEILFKRAYKTTIRNIFLHSIYLINLANVTNKQNFHLSKLSLATYLNFMHTFNQIAKGYNSDIRIKGVVLHPGSAKGAKDNNEAIKRVQYGINWVLDKTPKDTIILIENTAGSGQIIGDTLEELQAIKQGIDDKSRIKFCIDTQHIFASGYDVKDDLNTVLAKIDKTIGLSNVELFHLNDSMTELGSHKDRHQNLGDGQIGINTFKQLLNNSKLDDKSFVLETPALAKPDTAIKEIKKMLGLVN